MDIKKLSRGDAVIALAALLIFGFSFAAYFKMEGGGQDWNAWASDFSPLLPAVVLVPIISAVLYILSGLLPNPPQIVGLTLRQWAIPLATFGPIYALWSMTGKEGAEAGVGGIFIVLANFLLTAGVFGTELLPALKAPLGLSGVGAGAGAGAPAGAYGQPGGYAPAPQPGAYGGPSSQPGAPFGSAPGSAPGSVPVAEAFQPYWFSVPEQRQLVDANTNAPTGSLNPGVWYLAVAQHGQGLLVEVDGVRGVLWNVQGIQKS